MRATSWRLIRAFVAFMVGSFWAQSQSQSASEPGLATILGVVLDRADGAALADVRVRLQEGKDEVATDAEGLFELSNVPAARKSYLEQ